jgi:hypothetical protein
LKPTAIKAAVRSENTKARIVASWFEPSVEEATREAALAWLKDRFEDIKALAGEECP